MRQRTDRQTGEQRGRCAGELTDDRTGGQGQVADGSTGRTARQGGWTPGKRWTYRRLDRQTGSEADSRQAGGRVEGLLVAGRAATPRVLTAEQSCRAHALGFSAPALGPGWKPGNRRPWGVFPCREERAAVVNSLTARASHGQSCWPAGARVTPCHGVCALGACGQNPKDPAPRSLRGAHSGKQTGAAI